MDASKQVTDFTYLVSLSDGDEAFMDEMKTIFLKENPEEIQLLDEAIQNADFEEIKRLSHQIRSSIPFVGLDLLIDKELKNMGTWSEGKQEIEKIKTAFKHVKSVCGRAFLELMP